VLYLFLLSAKSKVIKELTDCLLRRILSFLQDLTGSILASFPDADHMLKFFNLAAIGARVVDTAIYIGRGNNLPAGAAHASGRPLRSFLKSNAAVIGYGFTANAKTCFASFYLAGRTTP